MATYTKIPSSNTSLNLASYTNIPSSVSSLNSASYINIPPYSANVTPDTVANLEMWLKADSIAGNDGDQVTTWTMSGGTSGVSPTQATAGKRPLLKKGANGLNGLNVVRFDGVDDFMLGTLNAGATGFTIFIVARPGSSLNSYSVIIGSGGTAGTDNPTTGIYWAFACETTAGGAGFEAGWAGAAATVHLGPFAGQAINTPFYSRYSYDKTVWAVDGPNNTTPADTSFPTGTFQFHVGCDASAAGAPSGPWKGDIAEVIVYSRTLTATELSALTTYVRNKWAV